MTVWDKEVIDFKYIDDTMWLYIFDDLDWNQPQRHIKLLKNKINYYVDFIKNKEYVTNYPEYNLNKFIISITCTHTPTTDGISFFTDVSKILEAMDIGTRLVVEFL